MEWIFILIILIFSVVLHEVSHGWMALSQGDSTAKDAGRLTLNPIPHLDPIGSILVPGLLLLLPIRGIIAWAKPVPVNPLNFREGKVGEIKVSLAGIASNLGLAVVFGLLLRFVLAQLGFAFELVPLMRDIVFLNLILAVFNLVPIPPLDGSRVFFAIVPPQLWPVRDFLYSYGFFILIALIFLIPGLFFSVVFTPILLLFELIVGVPLFTVPGIL